MSAGPAAPPPIEVTTGSEQETMDLAARLARQLAGGEVIGLEGELGAGKTCFVRGLAAGLGLDPSAVSSPTFVIMQRHEPAGVISPGLISALVHVDAFRLAGPADLESIGWDELLARGGQVIAVEWADRIAGALPPRSIRVVMSHAPGTQRHLRMWLPPDLAGSWGEGAAHRCPICGSPAYPSAATFPFCSTRCRLVDLGRWMDEAYRVEG